MSPVSSLRVFFREEEERSATEEGWQFPDDVSPESGGDFFTLLSSSPSWTSLNQPFVAFGQPPPAPRQHRDITPYDNDVDKEDTYAAIDGDTFDAPVRGARGHAASGEGAVSMDVVEELEIDHGSDDSPSSISSATCSWDGGEMLTRKDFNAPIHPSLWYRSSCRLMVILAQASQILYLSWRWCTFVSQESTWALSFPLIIAESLIVMCGSFITYVLLWNQIECPKLRLNVLPITTKDLPSVDVMIPCYNEPVEVRSQQSIHYS